MSFKEFRKELIPTKCAPNELKVRVFGQLWISVKRSLVQRIIVYSKVMVWIVIIILFSIFTYLWQWWWVIDNWWDIKKTQGISVVSKIWEDKNQQTNVVMDNNYVSTGIESQFAIESVDMALGDIDQLLTLVKDEDNVSLDY